MFCGARNTKKRFLEQETHQKTFFETAKKKQKTFLEIRKHGKKRFLEIVPISKNVFFCSKKNTPSYKHPKLQTLFFGVFVTCQKTVGVQRRPSESGETP